MGQDGIVGPATLSALNSSNKLQNGNKNVKVTASLLNIRESSTTSSKIIGKLQNGSIIEIEKEENGWGKIINNGWICL